MKKSNARSIDNLFIITIKCTKMEHRIVPYLKASLSLIIVHASLIHWKFNRISKDVTRTRVASFRYYIDDKLVTT